MKNFTVETNLLQILGWTKLLQIWTKDTKLLPAEV